ncbi:MAG: quinolinate synthase NadA, partial [Firmicutes bacterium]|nr:quinolinate synthase NadA [Bacillota bacterium]
AGCSLADSITAEEVRAWKTAYPQAAVVAYINTSAEVKALSDYCCTSANAVQVVQTIDPSRDILFLPDKNLGRHVAHVTRRRNIHIWEGGCHVHAQLTAPTIAQAATRYPDAEVLVHPESAGASEADSSWQLMSTNGMIEHARQSSAHTFIVATEIGLLTRLRQAHPTKRFIAADAAASCRFMNRITVEKIRDSLKYFRYEVKVPQDLAQKAWHPIERMLAINGTTSASPPSFPQ